ncbi:MAG: alpha-galactosidase [Henriciella sp.]
MREPEAELIHLRGRAVSVVMDVSYAKAPVWRHWGARLPAEIKMPPWGSTQPVPTFSLDQNIPPSLFPLFGSGWLGAPGLTAHRGGQNWAQKISAATHNVEGNTVRFHLRDEAAGLEMTHTLVLDPVTDVLTQSVTLLNAGTAALDVSWLTAGTLPLPNTAKQVRSFSGLHNNEYLEVQSALGRSTWLRENRSGLTSHDCPPLASVLGSGAGQHSGAVWSAQLAWSGNHCQRIDWLDDHRWLWMAGEWLAPGEVILEPGESLSSPQWLATYSDQGFDGTAQNFHAELRRRAPVGEDERKPRPVHLNTWEGVYFDHDEGDLKALAEAAADIGVERFVLDDGWFKGRKNDRAALGDWVADPETYPQGLGPLAKHVTDLGMGFGLWVEPEMVNPDSDLYRANPDWALQLAGQPSLTARNQLVLDLSRREVRDYLFEALDKLLRDLPIEYLKWDHNRALTLAASADGRPAYRRQVLAAYALIDRVRVAHPEIEIEACAAGGGRIDAGILTRTDRVWTSDCIDAVSRMDIQRGFLQFFPPEIMGAHIGAAPAHSTGRSQAMAFRGAVALPGHLGVELDPRRLSEEERAELKDWIGLYKTLRAELHGAAVWRGDAGDGVQWQAHGDADEFLLFIYRVRPTAQRYPPPVRLPFITPEAQYHLSRIDPAAGAHDGAIMDSFQRLEAGSLKVDGAWLREAGLSLPFMKAETSMIIRATKTD